jgi:hypothetical protein
VLNRAPRSRRQRNELCKALAGLMDGQLGGRQLPSPIYLPDRRVEAAIRDGVALPAPLPATLADTVALLIAAPRGGEAMARGPVPVAPGSLGSLGISMADLDEGDVA